MPFLTASERRFLDALSQLAYCNPFKPQRIELERAALGRSFEHEESGVWSRTTANPHANRPNVAKLTAKADALARKLRAGLAEGEHTPDEQEKRWYEDLATYVLYYRWMAPMSPAAMSGHKTAVARAWRSFRADYEHFFQLRETSLAEPTAEHLFACLYQVRRAFVSIFDCILGESLPAARLRAAVWQSIFTHDMRRYRRSLYPRMVDLATLITGPSGAGKELVAQAIALSQYVAFDAGAERFVCKPDEGFLPVNLSALSPTLIESELFGHCRGAFTGAVSERDGWLANCPASGAVFLDEIGELDPTVQVKLLRVVQNRVFNRLGETAERPFVGKIIAATNRDLAEEMQAGRFRHDLYYRLCGDRVEVPPLRAHLADRPGAIVELIRAIAQRVVGGDSESGSADAEQLADEVGDWIDANLGPEYPWTGNIRELEQCIRNILVRQQYVPRSEPADPPPGMPAWLNGVDEGTLTAEELVSRYCTAVYARLASYEQTAKRLGLDRRTVKSKVDKALLERLRA